MTKNGLPVRYACLLTAQGHLTGRPLYRHDKYFFKNAYAVGRERRQLLSDDHPQSPRTAILFGTFFVFEKAKEATVR